MDFWSGQQAPSIVDEELRVQATDKGRELIDNCLVGSDPKIRVLEAVVEHGPITVRGISEETGISSTKNISRICKTLKKNQYIMVA